jgi:glucose/mannose-6-phosphate isomerase
MKPLEPPYRSHDASAMLGRIEDNAAQIRAALDRAAETPWRIPIPGPRLLAVGGLGGSAIAGELTAALTLEETRRPILVVRDHHWPAWVTRDALALLCSYSGDTAETLSLYDEAGERQAPRVAMTTGGALAERCERDGVFWQPLPPGSPPRAALFASWVPLTFLVHGLAWCADPTAGWVEAASVVEGEIARYGHDVAEKSNPVKQLARAMHGRLPFVYGGPGLTGAIATRVRQQLNENAKLPAHSAVVPELNHNEIVGWERPSDLHARVSVLVLRDSGDSADVARRLTLTAEYAARQGATVHEWSAVGKSRIARLASLAQFADHLSFYLAMLGGVDPTPIASIDEFKKRLSEANAAS